MASLPASAASAGIALGSTASGFACTAAGPPVVILTGTAFALTALALAFAFRGSRRPPASAEAPERDLGNNPAAAAGSCGRCYGRSGLGRPQDWWQRAKPRFLDATPTAGRSSGRKRRSARVALTGICLVILAVAEGFEPSEVLHFTRFRGLPPFARPGSG